MMKLLRRAALAALVLVASPVLGQQAIKVATAAALCTDGSPRIYAVVDATSSTDCSTGGGATENLCSCLGGVLVDFGGGGSGTSVALDLDADGGTDSSGVTRVEVRNNYERLFADESSADVLRLNGKPQDTYLSTCGFGNTPDDDFNSGTLAGKWTAASGASGTVDLFETGNVSEYDLSSVPGYLLTQAGLNASQEVHLRQDYTLPDGNSLIVKMMMNRASGSNGNAAGIAVNSTDSGWESGTFLTIHADAEVAGTARIVSYDGSVIGSGSGTTNHQQAFPVIYFRIARVGLDYHTFYSDNGVTWNFVATKTFGSAADNIWIWHQSNSTNTGLKAAILAWDWVCLGDNDMRPF